MKGKYGGFRTLNFAVLHLCFMWSFVVFVPQAVWGVVLAEICGLVDFPPLLELQI